MHYPHTWMVEEMGQTVSAAEPTHRLHWKIRESFVGYVRGARGTIEVADPAYESGDVFTFPARLSDDGEGRTFRADGSVRFSAHGGKMTILIADLVAIDRDGAAQVTVSDSEGKAMAIARGQWSEVEGMPALELKLTFMGTRVFGDVYDVGAEMGLITIEELAR